MKRHSTSMLKTTLAAAAMIVTALAATAQTPDARAMDGRWHFLAGLYGWFPAIEGTVSAREVAEIPIDVPFSELWDHLKMNLTFHGEARKGCLGFGVDLFYVRLAAPILGEVPEFFDADVNLRQFIGEGFAFYRVAHGGDAWPWSLDVLAGARFWDVNTRIESDIADGDGRTIDWVDGFGGLRVELPLAKRLSLIGRGDVGAGGAELDWSASGDLAFALGKGWVSGAGYRALNVEYEKDGATPFDRAVVDLQYAGPRVWIVYTF